MVGSRWKTGAVEQGSGRAWALLAAGFVMLALAQTRWGVPIFAWVAPIPLLAALRARPGWRFGAVFAAALVLTWILITAKIVTAPVPWLLAPSFGIPIALFHLPPYWLWSALVRRGRNRLAVGAFAAGTALLEWAQAELTPAGVWGATPTTQVGQLAVLQTLALVGMPGLSFLMSAVPALVERAIFEQGRAERCVLRRLVPAGLVAAALLAWGAVRAVRPLPGPEVLAALVRTDSTVTGLPLPEARQRHRDDATLLARTAAAARAGAAIVVWPEAANVVLPAEEPAYVMKLAETARQHQIELVVSYIAPLADRATGTLEPLRYENRARWFAPDGRERLAYLKHHPVPGEPAVPGAAPAPTFQTTFGPATAAICYDYDFPALGRTHARAGAGVVALPSSDWRGIDPIHTEMAAMRAIEGGYSILRSTRFGLSAGIDAHGRLRGQVSTNETSAPYLLVSVPTTPIWTLYAALGNLVLVPLVALVLLGLFAVVSRRVPTKSPQVAQESKAPKGPEERDIATPCPS